MHEKIADYFAKAKITKYRITSTHKTDLSKLSALNRNNALAAMKYLATLRLQNKIAPKTYRRLVDVINNYTVQNHNLIQKKRRGMI